MDGFTGEREIGVGHGRGDGRHPGLTDTGRWRVRRHDMDLDGRHLVDAKLPIVVEIRWTDPTAVDLDLVIEGGAETKADTVGC